MYPLHAACIRDRFLPLDARRVHAAPAGHHPQTTVLCSRKPSFVLSDRLLDQRISGLRLYVASPATSHVRQPLVLHIHALRGIYMQRRHQPPPSSPTSYDGWQKAAP